MRLNGNVKVRLDKLAAIRERVKPDGDRLTKWKKRSAQRYRSFLFKRFNKFSRGGGNWRNTKRRKAGKTRFILRKTHTLYKALSPVYRGLPGQYERLDRNYIETGYGGSGRHPNAKMTVANLAKIHNVGNGIIPQRQIIVSPSSEVIQDIKSDLQRSVT